MSVINSMLRDLDRRHAPMPINANVQPILSPPKRIAPRSALALSVLIVLVILSWSHQSRKIANPDSNIPQPEELEAKTQLAQPQTETKTTTAPKQPAISEPTNRRLTESPATTRREYIPIGSESASMPPTVAANDSVNRLAPQNSEAEKKEAVSVEKPTVISEANAIIPETKKVTPIIKQERQPVEDLIAERYQLARNALAQNQPERAYELLRENPPSLMSNTDYHAVLAAIEQQLKHFSDASLRYQQLLTVDQNQASWWLGLALSLEGQQRNIDALGAYRHALSLNSLPDAARQYAAARIAALSHSAE